MVREPDPVLKHVRFDVTVNQSKFCLLGSCLSKSTIFKGSHVTVHFKRFHQEEYELLVQEKKVFLCCVRKLHHLGHLAKNLPFRDQQIIVGV